MLFTLSNPKTQKGEAAGYLTAILHLAPARSAGGRTVCPRATPQCTELCLNTAGYGGIGLTTVGDNAVQAARRKRTLDYFNGPALFKVRLVDDIQKLRAQAHKLGLKLAVRINGTSDLPALAAAVARMVNDPSITFYDYTKIENVLYEDWESPVHYTFSRSETNEAACLVALKQTRVNVAVVFSTRKGQPLPASYTTTYGHTFPVLDGDTTDLRFLDPRGGHVVGLRAKGRARKLVGGFVVQV